MKRLTSWRKSARIEWLICLNNMSSYPIQDVKVQAKTIKPQHDTGEWTNLKELLEYQQEAYKHLKDILEKKPMKIGKSQLPQNEFGTKTKAEAIGRIISHTAYHAGQLA